MITKTASPKNRQFLSTQKYFVLFFKTFVTSVSVVQCKKNQNQIGI